MAPKNKVHLMIESSISTGFYNFIQKEFDEYLHWFYFVNSGNGHGVKKIRSSTKLSFCVAIAQQSSLQVFILFLLNG